MDNARQELISPEVGSSWTDAGAEIGWCEGGTSIMFKFELDPAELPAPIPAFRFCSELSPHAKLIDPGQPFGVCFAFSNHGLPDQFRFLPADNLHCLSYDGTDFTEEYADLLPALPNLRRLSLGDSPLGDRGLQALTHLKNLQVLNVGQSQLTDDSLRFIGDMERLCALDLWGNEITDDGILHLTRLASTMRELGLALTSITDVGVGHLEEFAMLNYLNLWSTDVTDAAVVSLAKLPRLEYLDIGQTEMSGRRLNTLEGLVCLEVRDCDVTEEGLLAIRELRSLEFLDLSDVPLDDSARQALSAADFNVRM